MPHSCVMLKCRVMSSPGYAGGHMSVVKENGSGTGSRWFCQMYFPAAKCHHVSESDTSREKAHSRNMPVNSRIRGRTHEGAAAGLRVTDCRGAGWAAVRGRIG